MDTRAGHPAELASSPPLFETAQALIRQGNINEAIATLAKVTQDTQAIGPALTLQLEVLLAAGRYGEAEAAFDAAMWLPRPSADALDAMAFYARKLGRHALSNRLYRGAAITAPDDSQLQYNLATSERSLGRLSHAAEACAEALRLDPSAFPALLLRSEVTRATTAANHITDLQARLATTRSDRGRMFTAYALGKELHDVGDYDGAFAAFQLGAGVRRRNLDYDIATDEAKLHRIAEAFADPSAAQGAEPGAGARHLFIVGLPRSGTTLLERILGALPQVRSNGETDNFAHALLHASPRGTEDVFTRCAKAPAAAVAERYEALAAHGGFAGTIIEKLPLNYLYVGAIRRALPAARIVWMRRHPLDSCFAMFRTLFAEAYPFSYDLEELGRYYVAYQRLMRHWAPASMIEVSYEALARNPRETAREVAERCGLAWSDDALDLTRNHTASLTASAPQVRGEIYATSCGVWRSYARHLAPLTAVLSAGGLGPEHWPD
ncbi:MAG: sulfotransferase [Pseudomonadota bacterium]